MFLNQEETNFVTVPFFLFDPLLNASGRVTLSNCIFLDGFALSPLLQVSDVLLGMENCTFNNYSGIGILSMFNSQLIISSTGFFNNFATDSLISLSGGTTATVVNTTFDRNLCGQSSFLFGEATEVYISHVTGTNNSGTISGFAYTTGKLILADSILM